MPTKIIGTAPYQVPRNSDLGTLAVQDLDSVNIQGGAVVLGASSTQGYFQNTDVSDVKPSLLLDFANGKSLDPRITFTRSTNATYYDGCTTAKAEENLLTYSQYISNSTWTLPSSGNWIPNATMAPDGTITASKAEEYSTAIAAHQFYQGVSSLSSGTVTCSVYLKAAERTWAAIGLGGGNVYASYNLSNGTLGTVIGTGTSSIVSVGNGWYRCILVIPTNTGGVNFSVWPTTSDSTGVGNFGYAGTIGYGIYVWGAQVENRSGASAYTPTTSSPITNYIPQLQTATAGMPRFDHDPVTGESKGLLMEEQRTNNVTYSQDFSPSAWNKTYGAGVINNSNIAPDGTLTAGKIYAYASDNYHFLAGSPSSSMNGVTNTLSVYAKAAEYKFISLAERSFVTAQASFDLVNGTVVSQSSSVSSATITPVGNGWFRCTVTLSTRGDICIHPLPSPPIGNPNSAQNYVGDGISGVYVWGVQVEASSHATSYIPTAASTATRAGDLALMYGYNFTSWYNGVEGTLYAEANLMSISAKSYQRIFSIHDSSTSNSFVLLDTLGSNVRGLVSSSASFTIAPQSGYNKYTLTYKNNDFACALNGGSLQNDTSGYVPYNVVQAGIGCAAGSNIMNGWIKKIAYYPKRLSDAELQEITL